LFSPLSMFFFFSLIHTPPTELYTLSLHDALPISEQKAPIIPPGKPKRELVPVINLSKPIIKATPTAAFVPSNTATITLTTCWIGYIMSKREGNQIDPTTPTATKTAIKVNLLILFINYFAPFK